MVQIPCIKRNAMRVINEIKASILVL
ncbi:MAG: hypothetical protein COA59_02840 [Colwellia sp.]|nr:MAG: hypothetical protein COA59_02840 [Colwellia sp.]